MSDLSAKIKSEARRLGFSLVGITSADPPAHAEFYRAWIEASHHGEMHYLGSDRAMQARSDPRRILPECESIIALAIPYSSPQQGPETGRGQIAAYAWGEDYHDILKDRLRAIVEFIETEIGRRVPNRWYTDTGPILERDLAQRAGLGWIGKNSCLIHPQGGSTFFLAEILLGVPLEPDAPFVSDHCGSCSRCIEACPTDCILPDRTLDAPRCISYLTIELKGPIPAELRSKTGNWIFGCDICQEVCPWNVRFAPPDGEPAFQPGERETQPELAGELALDPQEFNRKFKGSPIRRAKRRGYLRNVTVALGNSGDPDAAAPLARCLAEEPEALVRQHAAWALGEIGGPDATAALHLAANLETDPEVRSEISRALDTIRRAAPD